VGTELAAQAEIKFMLTDAHQDAVLEPDEPSRRMDLEL
jgi:hypothetical protein